MNQHLQSILDHIQQSESLSASEKITISNTIKEVDKILTITEFKLERTEKVKRTTAILLEETIEELEQKRKAVEAQNRKLEIETSLERVRSVAMGMKQPADMLDVCHIISDQLQLLHVADIRNVQTAIIDESKGTYNNYQYFTQYQQGTIEEVEYNKHPKVHELVQQMQRSPDAFFSGEFKGKELEVWRQYRKDENQFPDPILDEATAVYYYFYSIGQGGLGVSTYTPLIEDDIIIFKRFRNVFDLAYRRFLDIQQAEAQAREAQIEVAIERVRAKALAMHKSEDLHSVVVALKKELMGLRIPNITAATIYLAQNDGSIRVLDLSDTGGEDDDKPQLQLDKIFRLEETDPDLWISRMWNRSENYFVLEADEADFARIVQWLRTVDPTGAEIAEKIIREKSIKKAWLPTVKLEKGRLNIDLLEPPTDEIKPILLKMGAGFDLAYKRFLDLQNAEAQAREAIIDAALEKVRGKAMTMQSSKDVTVTAGMVFTELRKLGITPIRTGIGLLNKENRMATVFAGTQSEEGDALSLTGTVLLDHHPTFVAQYDCWVKQEDFFPVLPKEKVKEYYAHASANFNIPVSRNDTDQYGFFLPFTAGFLFGWSEKPYTSSEINLLNRFKSIIDLTFRRYLDLQKAETNARDAVRQASLDRVRAEIASMRTTGDLEKITPLIWNELSILGVPFIRCGVFIMDEELQLIHTFLSTPEGNAIAAFHLPYSSPGNIGEVLVHWKKNENYIDHWDETAFIEFANVLVKEGALASPEKYLSTMPKGGFYLHFLPFLQGMFYVGNTAQLSGDEMKLIQSVADAFSTAYARYEDFNKLEAAKKQVDNTLIELQVAQKQLIQSEKMASLGELTAGIAHEIQNPLNFVNNFSELNTELIDELNNELAIGNVQLAKEIGNNIKENEEKIIFHGKRAGAIVKGMLMHSRSSSGVKEPTDINALADEYLRLAYHGLRAKDKSFNATMKSDYDESIGLINVIPQDIGRVILNLITNAFYAVSNFTPQPPKGGNTSAPRSPEGDLRTPNGIRDPTVIVSTKLLKFHSGDLGANKVEIRVKDNGSGIPKHLLDKIFQPFFTTKPTGQGTGLGLSLSYDIVKAHGGDLKVETKEGEGTTFIINLPIA